MGNTYHDVAFMREGISDVGYDLIVRVKQNDLTKNDLRYVTINGIQVSIVYLWLLLDMPLADFLVKYNKYHKITTQILREISVFKQQLILVDYNELLKLVGNTPYYRNVIDMYFETDGLQENTMHKIEELFLKYIADLNTLIMYKNKYKWSNKFAVTNKINSYLGPLSVTYDLNITSVGVVNLIILVLFVSILFAGLITSILYDGPYGLIFLLGVSLCMIFLVHYKHVINFMNIRSGAHRKKLSD